MTRSKKIHDVRASSICYRLHPCTFQFYPEARLVKSARVKLLVDEIWKESYHAHEQVIGAEQDDSSHVLLGRSHPTISALFKLSLLLRKLLKREVEMTDRYLEWCSFPSQLLQNGQLLPRLFCLRSGWRDGGLLLLLLVR